MSTRRQDILDNIREAIKELVIGVGDVEINRAEAFGEGTVYPAFNIRSGAESMLPEESSLGMDEWEFEVPIDVVAKGDPEAMLGQLHQAVMNDVTRGGLADDTTRTAAEIRYDLNNETGASGLTVTYNVRYEVPRGTA